MNLLVFIVYLQCPKYLLFKFKRLCLFFLFTGSLQGLFMSYFKEILETTESVSVSASIPHIPYPFPAPPLKKQNKTKTKPKKIKHHHFLSTKQAVELQLSCFFHLTLLLRLHKSNMIWKQVGQSPQGLVRLHWSVSHKHNIYMQPSLQLSRKKPTRR